MFFRLEKPVFLLLNVCNNDSYCDKWYGLGLRTVLKDKGIALSAKALKELQTLKEFFLFFFSLQTVYKHRIL